MNWRWSTKGDLVAMEARIFEQLRQINQGEKDEMIALKDLAAVEAAERDDLKTLTGLVTQILTAVATGQMDQTAAQALLDAMNTDDATVKSNISTIQAALPVAPPVEPPPAAPTA